MADPISTETAEALDDQFRAEQKRKRLAQSAKPAAPKASSASPPMPSAVSAVSAATSAASSVVQGAASAASTVAQGAASAAPSVARAVMQGADLSPAHILSSEDSKKKADDARAALRRAASGAAKINRYYAKFKDIKPLRAGRVWTAHDTQTDIDAELLRIYDIRNSAGNENMCKNIVLGLFDVIQAAATPKAQGGYGLITEGLSDIGTTVKQSQESLEPELTEMAIELSDWFSSSWQMRLMMKLFYVTNHAYKLKTDPQYAKRLVDSMKKAREAAAAAASGEGRAAAAAASKDL